ncbi:hypothetical protein IQ07DRAFT_590295 [Pyrenochaeta sp. DS3sAY3a]|nr:hypothetical protein IQ07DRAFT_590295 [Pyrenochaeta sp. DS3sAY3a]
MPHVTPWHCHACNTSGQDAESSICENCYQRKGTWFCRAEHEGARCGKRNTINDTCCSRCGAAKPPRAAH